MYAYVVVYYVFVWLNDKDNISLVGSIKSCIDQWKHKNLRLLFDEDWNSLAGSFMKTDISKYVAWLSDEDHDYQVGWLHDKDYVEFSS